MEKQDKVINKIKKSLSHGQSNTTLGVKNDDECYTSMTDILNELKYWAGLGKFKDKKIICPCDWDIVDGEEIYSITITYKDSGVEVLSNNVYKAVATVQYDLWSNDTEPVVTKITLKEEEIEPFLRNKLTCNFVRTLTQNARRWGIKSITASGYNPANGKGIPFQDIDYTKYDICVTNPPFSLKDEFMACVVDNINFIVLLPFVSRNKNPIGIPLMLNKAFIGYSGNCAAGYLALNFKNPTKENKYHTKKVACDWITSYPEAQLERNSLLKKDSCSVDYNLYRAEYIVIDGITMKDGTHPIRVPCTLVPDNYDGWMFSPVNILTKISLEEYEWYSTDTTSFFNKDPHGVAISPYLGHWTCENIKIGDKKLFGGIVFRKKQNKETK